MTNQNLPTGLTSILLANRAIAEVSGQDARHFLHDLVTADVAQLTAGQTCFSALLTPQGKFLDDFFVIQPGVDPNCLWIDINQDRLLPLAQRLALYKLKADVSLKVVTPKLAVEAWLHERPAESPDDLVVADPRSKQMGWRCYKPNSTAKPDPQAYDQRRISLGLPDGSVDLDREKSTLFDNAYDRAGAIAWAKGCYMGQEITARMRYRGLAKWDLLAVELTAENLDTKAALTLDDKPVGQLKSVAGRFALARVRLEALPQFERIILGDRPLGRLVNTPD